MTTSNLPEAGNMTFWEHLEELRTRLMRSALAFVVGAGIAWNFKEQLLIWITQPFVLGWHGPVGSRPTLHFPAPASLFISYIKLSVLAGGVLALPFVLYQIWAFIAPGLYSKEKRLALPFVFSSCLLFVAGGYFGWRFAFPLAFDYLLGFSTLPVGSPIVIDPNVMVDQYLEFVIQALVGFGVVFEIPVVIFFLTTIGLVNYKQLIAFFRYFVVIAFVVSAILTPPDPLSQLLLAGPLCLLYGISIGIAYLFGKKPAAP